MKQVMNLRSRVLNTFVSITSSVFMILGASAWIAGRDAAGIGGLIWGTAVGFLSLVATVRAARAGLVITDTEIILRGYLRTRRVPLHAIRRFSSEGSRAPIGGEILLVERLEEKALRFPELWSFRNRVSENVTELNRRLADHRGSSAG